MTLLDSPELKNLSRYVRGYLGGLRSLHMEIDGEEFKYLEGGKGETVLFLHGMMGSKTQWRSMMRAYSERYRVISIDVPGLCLHSGFNQKKYSLRQLALWLDQVLASMRLSRVHLVCHALGCAVGAYFSATRPSQVQSAVFISFPDIFRNKGEVFSLYLNEMNDILQSDSLLPLQNYYKRSFTSPPSIPGVVLRYNLREVKKFRQRLIGAMSDLATSSPLLMAQMRQIKASVVVINGEEDQVAPLLKQAYWQQTLPQAEYLELPECGHMLHMEKADLASELLTYTGLRPTYRISGQ